MSETAKWWPSESSSRRTGWTQGRACVLVDGNEWFLPVVDDGLIVYLETLWPLGVITNQTLKAMYERHEFTSDHVEDFNRYVGEFINQLFAVQYSLPEQTIADLTYGQLADQSTQYGKLAFIRLLRVVIAWTDKMIETIGPRLGTIEDGLN